MLNSSHHPLEFTAQLTIFFTSCAGFHKETSIAETMSDQVYW